jgi:tRNA pseudouridine38-40 synthase
METRNYRMLLQYDGTDYAGWQIQSSLRTVQGTLQQALERVAGHPIRLTGSGRTDAGVHARGQVANFYSFQRLPLDAWIRAINRLLPADIRVLRVTRAASGFHSRLSAIGKHYRYQIYTGPILSPWDSRYFLHWTRPLDLEAMQQAARMLIGHHDMSSFAASGTTVRCFERAVTRSEFRRGGRRLVYDIEANGFLQHMVRILVGTLLEVGIGRFSVADFQAILQSRDRTRAGKTAPPQGLFLQRVFYQRRCG